MVEQFAVNEKVAGSSPASGAILNHHDTRREHQKICKGLFVGFTI